MAPNDLLGLKEKVIIGHLIPAGRGIYRYAEIDIEPPAGYAALLRLGSAEERLRP